MKLIGIFSIVVIILSVTVLVLGVVSGPETFIEAETTIEAPQAVVFRILNDISAYPEWCPAIEKNGYSVSNGTREVTYRVNDRRYPVVENISIDEPNHSISFVQTDSLQRSFVYNIQNLIKVTVLPDGTTEVRWAIRYQVVSSMGKVLNQLILKPAFNGLIKSNLKALKANIER